MFDAGAVGDPTHQQHDFESGITRSGLFWTIPIAPSAISFNPATGQARFRAHNVRIKDFHDFFSAIKPGAKSVPSHVSFDVRWHGRGAHKHLRDHTFGFEGKYVTGKATIDFTASQNGGGVTYKSSSAGQYNPSPKAGGAGAPAIGHERNGSFFHSARVAVV